MKPRLRYSREHGLWYIARVPASYETRPFTKLCELVRDINRLNIGA